jgi:hypothetical protein
MNHAIPLSATSAILKVHTNVSVFYENWSVLTYVHFHPYDLNFEFFGHNAWI